MIDPRFEAGAGTAGLAWVPPETTGRQIVVFAEADDDRDIDWQNAGISNVADSRDFAGGDVSPDTLNDAQATVFAELGIAVVSADLGQMGALQASAADSRPVLSVSPELVHHVLRTTSRGTRRPIGTA